MAILNGGFETADPASTGFPEDWALVASSAFVFATFGAGVVPDASPDPLEKFSVGWDVEDYGSELPPGMGVAVFDAFSFESFETGWDNDLYSSDFAGGVELAIGTESFETGWDNDAYTDELATMAGIARTHLETWRYASGGYDAAHLFVPAELEDVVTGTDLIAEETPDVVAFADAVGLFGDQAFEFNGIQDEAYRVDDDSIGHGLTSLAIVSLVRLDADTQGGVVGKMVGSDGEGWCYLYSQPHRFIVEDTSNSLYTVDLTAASSTLGTWRGFVSVIDYEAINARFASDLERATPVALDGDLVNEPTTAMRIGDARLPPNSGLPDIIGLVGVVALMRVVRDLDELDVAQRVRAAFVDGTGIPADGVEVFQYGWDAGQGPYRSELGTMVAATFGVATPLDYEHFEPISTPTLVTVNPSTDMLFTGGSHDLSVGDVVIFANEGGLLPDGLSPGARYFVVATPAADQFQVSQTAGGSALDIQDFGTGGHTYTRDPRDFWIG